MRLNTLFSKFHIKFLILKCIQLYIVSMLLIGYTLGDCIGLFTLFCVCIANQAIVRLRPRYDRLVLLLRLLSKPIIVQ